MIQISSHPLLLFAISFFFFFPLQSNFAGSIAIAQPIQLGSIDISQYPSHTTLHLQFIIQKPVSATYIAVSDEAEPPQKQISQFCSLDPSTATDYDLDAMWDFRTQRITIIKKPKKDKLFYIIQNYDHQRQYGFQQQESISYIIKLSPNCPLHQCRECQHGNLSPSLHSFQCFCESPYSGQACSRIIQEMANKKSKEVQISGYELIHLRLMPGSENLGFQVDGLIEVYIQLQTFQDQVASFYNTLNNNSSCKFTMGSHPSAQQINLISDQQYILVTVVNLLNSSSNLKITIFSQEILLDKGSATDTGIIIGVSVGSLLLIILISIIICKLCYRSTEQQKQSNSGYHSLSQNKIERYFPPFYAAFLLKNQNQNPHTSKDSCQAIQHNLALSKCPVCADQINEDDLIRILYCKHFVHSCCFQEWFNKKKSCPVCQKKYYLENTKKYYKAVVESKGKLELKGKHLGTAIYHWSLSKMQQIDSLFHKKQQIIVSMNMKKSKNII